MVRNLSDKVKYIGVDDLDLDHFESQYIVPEGMAYNSYLILDEKVAIMDTVDATKTQEWEQNLEKALDGKTPDYLIVQHLEPDHGGSVQYIMEKYPQMIAVCSQKAVAMFKRFFEKEEDVPRFAYTMGICDIMQAKRVVMVVSGESKAEIVKRAFFGPVTPMVPASILQLHTDFTLVADEAALKEI